MRICSRLRVTVLLYTQFTTKGTRIRNITAMNSHGIDAKGAQIQVRAWNCYNNQAINLALDYWTG
jgi:hypothetical protein